ncbi:MAG: hypothetical protein ACRDRE_25570 [Pseudonocardiaceae bacterium]
MFVSDIFSSGLLSGDRDYGHDRHHERHHEHHHQGHQHRWWRDRDGRWCHD